jgi:hypothetical protein
MIVNLIMIDKMGPRSLLLGFIPTGGKGDFNIDVKNVDVGIVATLTTSSYPGILPDGLIAITITVVVFQHQ